jgi:hypothetical protein
MIDFLALCVAGWIGFMFGFGLAAIMCIGRGQE